METPHCFIQMDQMKQNIRSPYNANETSRFIELALIIDNALFKSFDSNVTKINQHYTRIVNEINSVSVPRYLYGTEQPFF